MPKHATFSCPVFSNLKCLRIAFLCECCRPFHGARSKSPLCAVLRFSGGSNNGGKGKPSKTGGHDDGDLPNGEKEAAAPLSRTGRKTFTVRNVRWRTASSACAISAGYELQEHHRREYCFDNDGKLRVADHQEPRSTSERLRTLLQRLFLPDGYPESVTEDYLAFSLWRAVQNVCSSFLNTVATQSLLFAVGLGKGAIPTAQAVNWVLKDGVGYFSRVLLGANFGRRFDENPKRWRVAADFMEDFGMGVEVVAPLVPGQFLLMASVANGAKSLASMTQSATRNCFYKSFAKQENLGDITAKGEVQGMTCKLVGMAAGIYVSNMMRERTSLRIGTSTVLAALHVLANLESYQVVALSTLNRSRLEVLIDHYIATGTPHGELGVGAGHGRDGVVRTHDLHPHLDGRGGPLHGREVLNPKQVNKLDKVLVIPDCFKRNRIQLGSPIASVVDSEAELRAVLEHSAADRYILRHRRGTIYVSFLEGATPRDMTKAYFHAYLLRKSLSSPTTTPHQTPHPPTKPSPSLPSTHPQPHTSHASPSPTTPEALTETHFDALYSRLAEHGWSTAVVLLGTQPNRFTAPTLPPAPIPTPRSP